MSGLLRRGDKVRLVKFGDRGAVGTVEEVVPDGKRWVRAFVRWPQGGGMWASISELELVVE